MHYDECQGYEGGPDIRSQEGPQENRINEEDSSGRIFDSQNKRCMLMNKQSLFPPVSVETFFSVCDSLLFFQSVIRVFFFIQTSNRQPLITLLSFKKNDRSNVSKDGEESGP